MGIIKRHISILSILFFMLQSCGFNQEMKNHQYADNSVIENVLQANVGLIVDGHMMEKIVYKHGTRIKLYPGFYETMKSKYGGFFKSVRIVKADEVDSSYDVLIEANCDIINNEELFFTALIYNTNYKALRLENSKSIASTSGLQAAAYFALTFTIIGAPLAFNLSNSKNERNVHEALVSILDHIKGDVYTSVDKLSRKSS